jgi:hypothetical protein
MIYAATTAAQIAFPPPLPPPIPLSLNGTYGFTGTTACLYSPAGFNSGFQPLGNNWSSSFAFEGTWTFNPTGTGTAKGSNLGIGVPPTPGFSPGASSSNHSYAFTYNVYPDGSFTVDMVPGTFQGTALTGGRAGQTWTVQNAPRFTGLISRNGNTLTAATLTPPTVQTSTYSNGDILQQICHSSRVFVKM